MYGCIPFTFSSSRYANCLLATLNARLVLRSGADKHKSVAVWEYTASSDAPSRSGQMGSTHRTKAGNNVIQIHTQTQVQVQTDVELGAYPVVRRFQRFLSMMTLMQMLGRPAGAQAGFRH